MNFPRAGKQGTTIFPPGICSLLSCSWPTVGPQLLPPTLFVSALGGKQARCQRAGFSIWAPLPPFIRMGSCLPWLGQMRHRDPGTQYEILWPGHPILEFRPQHADIPLQCFQAPYADLNTQRCLRLYTRAESEFRDPSLQVLKNEDLNTRPWLNIMAGTMMAQEGNVQGACL